MNAPPFFVEPLVLRPMERGDLPLLPFVTIDNVFASPSFAKISVTGGPRLGSDHRPIIADLALAKPAKP